MLKVELPMATVSFGLLSLMLKTILRMLTVQMGWGCMALG
jgi:hypothetical protein